MSKFTIVLCVTLFASALDAQPLDSQLNLCERVERVTNSVFTEAENRLSDTKQIGDEEFEKILNATNQVIEENTSKILQLQLKMNSDLEHLYANATGVDISNCIKLSNGIDNTTMTVMMDTQICVQEKLQAGFKHMENVYSIYEAGNEFLAALKLKNDDTHCVGDTPKSTITKIAKLEVVAAQARYVIFDMLYPKMTMRIDLISAMLRTIKPSLPPCTDPGIIKFQAETSVIIDDTKRCIDEASTTNPKFDDSGILREGDGVAPYIQGPRVG